VGRGFAVMFDMHLGCFGSVVYGVLVVATGQVRVVCGRLVRACFVVLRGFLVVSRRVFVMLCGLVVMLSCFVCHEFPPFRLPQKQPAKFATTAGVSSRAVTAG
jgi:hypothetical protein